MSKSIDKTLTAILVAIVSFLVVLVMVETTYIGDDATARVMTVVGMDEAANLAAVSDGARIYSYQCDLTQLSIGDSLELVGIASGHAYVPEAWDREYNIFNTSISVTCGVLFTAYFIIVVAVTVACILRKRKAAHIKVN